MIYLLLNHHTQSMVRMVLSIYRYIFIYFTTFTGVQKNELCYCPKPYEDWFQQMGCSSNYSQIEQDLRLFEKVDMENVLDEAKSRFNIAGAYSFCHYSVVSNRVS